MLQRLGVARQLAAHRCALLGLLSSSLALASIRCHSQAQKGAAVPFVEGELQVRYSSKQSYKKLNAETMQHFVKAKIQNDRREIGLPEVDDWHAFAEGAVFIPTKSGALWVGEDDPRCKKFVTRKAKMDMKPGQLARRAPGPDPAVTLSRPPFS